MNWKTLLSDERLSHENRGEERDLRSAFGRDSHRIIESASFRRLQDKTQVFPLDKSDFIRTRLTHSLEVASIGKSLAQNVGRSVLTSGLDPDFTPDMVSSLCDVLECAGLIHDIGNPPFGHFGEEAIREWFRKNLAGVSYMGQSVVHFLSDEEREDLLHFEGNAQGLRLLTHLHFPVSDGGLNLTCAVLATAIKYPVSSLKMDPESSDIALHKMGYMASEADIVDRIEYATGACYCRTPMTFLLEAADDIAYATADIEDAFKKGFVTYEDLISDLREMSVKKEMITNLDKLHDMARLTQVENADEYAIRRWLLDVQDLLISEATQSFMKDYANLMAGRRKKELISERTPKKLLMALKTIAYNRAFTTSSIFMTEIAANNMLTFLLDKMVPAALAYEPGTYPGLMEEKYLSLISADYKQVYEAATRGRPKEECAYHRLLLATDSISGMTDSHAADLVRDLRG
ncbi:MAG: deoxyguanosinetriphosphate triphosphohydrolase [Lachnospiraceae bacterium]|nr:deoxyguanosinetriphosphate triphosphohydrolase [Lachnospiraceae bacterium]